MDKHFLFATELLFAGSTYATQSCSSSARKRYVRLSETHRAVLPWALRSPILPTRLGVVTATPFPPGPSIMLPQQRDLLPCWD